MAREGERDVCKTELTLRQTVTLKVVMSKVKKFAIGGRQEANKFFWHFNGIGGDN